jgi:hypothetical protein
MVLQGYFDDSGSSAKEPFYILAGFISTIDKWKSFSDAWRKKLNEYPGLAYFKMSEANALDGQFKRGWTPSTRDKCVFELAEIIKTHALVRVTSRLRRRDFDEFIVGIVDLPEVNDPYYLCFYQLVFAVHTYQLKNGGVDCDIIFDDQGLIGERTVKWWGADINRQPVNIPEERLKFFPKCPRPIFGNDRSFLPLQAADMLAWVVRQCQSFGEENVNLLSRAVIEQLRDLEEIDRFWGRDELLAMAVRAQIARNRELGLFP